MSVPAEVTGGGILVNKSPGAYVVIPPNLARRNQLQRIANQELEELEKWKEQHRPGPINLIPQKLGAAGLSTSCFYAEYSLSLHSKQFLPCLDIKVVE
ncbi:UNVERIFIED_CONTAM: hypothetical protein K2H54_003707 [Gekko kuhli]